MRVNCIICTDLFVSTSDISVTECGHIFHSHCIFQWLERSKTCPQCRRKTQDKKLVKLFLDCSEVGDDAPEPTQLQNDIENLKFKLTLKSGELNKLQEESGKLKAQQIALRDEVRQLEKGSRDKDDTVTALKMQLQCLSDVARDKRRVQEERDRLRVKLKLLSSVETVVSKSSEEVSDLLATYSADGAQAAKDMATFCLMLKKELARSVEERRKYSAERHQLRAQVQTARADSSRLQRQLETLQTQLTDQQDVTLSLEQENERLSRQVRALEAAVVSPSGDPRNSALTRLLTENTTPSELRSRAISAGQNQLNATVDLTSPTPERKANEESAGESSSDGTSVTTPRLALRGIHLNAAAAAAAAAADESDSDGVLSPPAPRLSAPLGRRPGSLLGRSGHQRPPGGSAGGRDCSQLKKTNLLMMRSAQRDQLSAAAAGSGVKRRSSGSADHGWDGLGGSSRPDIFPARQQLKQNKLTVRLKNNSGKVMRIDNFFSSNS